MLLCATVKSWLCPTAGRVNCAGSNSNGSRGTYANVFRSVRAAACTPRSDTIRCLLGVCPQARGTSRRMCTSRYASSLSSSLLASLKKMLSAAL